MTASPDRDVVLQSQEDRRVVLPLFHTNTACVGSVTGYVMRRIAYRAGAYAPGIQEFMFHDLNSVRWGADLPAVQRWLGSRLGEFHRMGYRLHYRWCAEPIDNLTSWVRVGRGYRGAIVLTDFEALHPEPPGGLKVTKPLAHAVGVVVDRPERSDELVMVDPWPGINMPDRIAVRPDLDDARVSTKLNGLIFYWIGWS
jgi:hypothetical protein